MFEIEPVSITMNYIEINSCIWDKSSGSYICAITFYDKNKMFVRTERINIAQEKIAQLVITEMSKQSVL